MYKILLLIATLLLLTLALNARASEVRTQILNFKTEIRIRDAGKISLLDVGTTGEYQLKINVLEKQCLNPEKINQRLFATIGVYPLADVPLSNTLRNESLGEAPWPKPSNMPILKDFNIRVEPDNFETRDLQQIIMNNYKRSEAYLKSHKLDVKELGVLKFPLKPQWACALLNGEMQIEAESQVEFVHPDQEVYRPLQVSQIVEAAGQLQNMPAHTGYVQASYNLAMALDKTLGSEFHKINVSNFSALANALFDNTGRLKLVTPTTALAIVEDLTVYKERRIKKSILIKNVKPMKEGDL